MKVVFRVISGGKISVYFFKTLQKMFINTGSDHLEEKCNEGVGGGVIEMQLATQETKRQPKDGRQTIAREIG